MAATQRTDGAVVGSNHARKGRVLQFVPREPGIVLSQEEAVQFLLRSAAEYEIVFCTKPGCEVCHAFVSTWESVYTGLAPRWKRFVDERLAVGQILPPVAPEEG